MKIVFLTSCLERGRDGVGDYTRFLAEECVEQGHACRLVALNDHHVSSCSTEREGLVPALRCGPSLAWPERIAKAKEFISAFGPDGFSLQFVCYGFHPKGVNVRLAARLKPLLRGAPLQIMMHEVWIGAELNARLKAKIVGAVQKHFVLGLLRDLAADVVHTSNPAYAGLLERNGITARPLPLFGSIPVRPGQDGEWLWRKLQQAGVKITPPHRPEFWLFGLFGTLHPVWPPEPLFRYLQTAAWRHGRKIVIGAIGRLGTGESLWRELVQGYSGAFRFVRLGEQAPERISEFLNALDFGIATTPWALIGKSATTAAMLEHGLPVIVNRDDVQFGGPPAGGHSPLLIRMDETLPKRLADIRRQPGRSIRSEVARRFLADLHQQFSFEATRGRDLAVLPA